MIITHTQNAEGQRRIYLGGKSSIECWLEPKPDGVAWTFHWLPAVTGQPIDRSDARDSALYVLSELSALLKVPPQCLVTVPFDRIAALHATDPFIGRRTSVGRRRTHEHGYVATYPSPASPNSKASRPCAAPTFQKFR